MVKKYNFVENNKLKIRELNEIPVQCGIQLALSREDNSKITNIHQWVYCKEFITDVWYSETFNKKSNIYGFRYSPTGYFKDKDKFHITLRYNKKMYTPKSIISLKNFMKKFSEIHNIPKIEVYKIEDEYDLVYNRLLFIVPTEITNDISLFTLTTTMIRLCLVYDEINFVKYFNKLLKIELNKYSGQHPDLLNIIGGKGGFKSEDFRVKVINYILKGGVSFNPYEKYSNNYCDKYSIHDRGYIKCLLLNELKINEENKNKIKTSKSQPIEETVA